MPLTCERDPDVLERLYRLMLCTALKGRAIVLEASKHDTSWSC